MLAPEQPWSKIRSLGNLLRHGYDEVDLGVIWRIARNDLGSLRKACETALAQFPTAEVGPGARRRPVLCGSYSTTWTGWSGGVRLPQKRVSSTLALVIAAPGILRFGPQSSIVSSDLSPMTS